MEEIRASFKRLVLASHPDKNPGRRRWSETRMRELIEAFDVLGDAQRRAAFDRRRALLGTQAEKADKAQPFFYYKKDPESRALLVLHQFLNGRPVPALKVLMDMEEQHGSDFLFTNLDRADYLDCLFLIAEHYLAKRRYLKAAERLQAFYYHEKRATFPRHYLGEVVRLLKDLYLRKIPRSGDDSAALLGLREAVGLGLTSAEEALRLAKIAELHLTAGNREEALRVLDSAQRQFPLAEDLKKIRKTLQAVG
jgi:tetratricopeptide (TPR) repeat protein